MDSLIQVTQPIKAPLYTLSTEKRKATRSLQRLTACFPQLSLQWFFQGQSCSESLTD